MEENDVKCDQEQHVSGELAEAVASEGTMFMGSQRELGLFRRLTYTSVFITVSNFVHILRCSATAVHLSTDTVRTPALAHSLW